MTDTHKFPCGCEIPIVDGHPQIDYNKLNYDCPKTWQIYCNGQTQSVFQLEKYLGKHWSKKCKPASIEDASAIIAAIRPGVLQAVNTDGVSMTEIYAKSKNGEIAVENLPILEPILEETSGVYLFQEQIMAIARDIAGFDGAAQNRLRKCVTGETVLISKKYGPLKISDILKYDYTTDLFLTIFENKTRWINITNIWSTGKQSTKNIKTKLGYSVCSTKYHRFMTDTGWKAASRLSQEDFIVCPNKIDWDGEDNISVSIAIVIAGMITEGYFSNKTKSGNRTTCNFTAFEPDFMQIFIDHYQKEFGITPTITDNAVRISSAVRDKINKYMDYGFSDSKFIPDIMMKMTKESMRQYLSFMLGAEGGVSKSGQFEFSSKSKRLIDQVKLLLLRFGIRSLENKKFNKKYQEYYYRLYINDREEQQKLYAELSANWPSYKKSEYEKHILTKSDIENYSINQVPHSIIKNLIDEYPYIGRKQSGSFYKKSITFNRFRKAIKSVDDDKYNDIAYGDISFSQVSEIENNGIQETYDFSTGDKNCPQIIANGLLIHNSVGKKDANLLNSLREEFISGCKAKGIVTEEQANFIFDQFRESARYLFNKSHSVGYAITGYWTAWVKAHLPRHYICAWLRIAKNEQKPLEEIRAMISEANRLNIPVSPPSIKNIPETDFFVKNRRIYFGVTSIKNCSEKTVTKLAKENLDLENMGWTEFLVMYSHLLSKTQLVSMIQVGCFDYMGESRMRCEFEYDQWSLLTERQKKLARGLYEQNPASSLQELLENFQNSTKKCSEKDKNLVHISRTLQRPPYDLQDSKINIVANERALLGINVSCSKVDNAKMPDAKDTCSDVSKSSLNSINKKDKYKVYVLIGEINDYNEFKIKAGKLAGKLMASFKLVDETGECDVVIFPEKLDLYQAAIYDENTVLVKGKLSNRGGIICDEVYVV